MLFLKAFAEFVDGEVELSHLGLGCGAECLSGVFAVRFLLFHFFAQSLDRGSHITKFFVRVGDGGLDFRLLAEAGFFEFIAHGRDGFAKLQNFVIGVGGGELQALLFADPGVLQLVAHGGVYAALWRLQTGEV